MYSKICKYGLLYVKLLVCTRLNIHNMYWAEIFPENSFDVSVNISQTS